MNKLDISPQADNVVNIFDPRREHDHFLASVGRICRDNPEFLLRMLGNEAAANRAMRLADDPAL